MFDFLTDPDASKRNQYRHLIISAEAITAGERDGIANMANVAARLWQCVPHLNWAGFYRAIDGELVLGPFMGKPACIRIAFGSGVCGAAAARGTTQLVPDVHQFPGHIACDPESRSALVVPVIRQNQVIAVIDLDSPIHARFDNEDAAGVEALARVIASRI